MMTEFYILAGINAALLFIWLGVAMERWVDKGGTPPPVDSNQGCGYWEWLNGQDEVDPPDLTNPNTVAYLNRGIFGKIN